LENTFSEKVQIFRFISKTEREYVSVDLTTPEGKKTLLKEYDIVDVLSNTDVAGEPFVEIKGAVLNPGRYRLLKNMHVLDLVYSARLNTFANRGHIEIVRKKLGQKAVVLSVDLSLLMKNAKDENNLILEDRDTVYVKYEAEAVKVRNIKVTGEVLYPGHFVAAEGERLSSLLKRSGGFTDNAFLDGAVFVRKSVKTRELQGHFKVIEDEKKRLIYDQSHLSTLAQDAQTTHQLVLQSRREAIQMLYDELGFSLGRIVVHLKPLNQFENSFDDFVLEDGDEIYIPTRPNSVLLIGGVRNATSLIYRTGERLDYYVDQVGGYTPYADLPNIYILKPNGTVSRDLKKVEAGDIVYVPEKVRIEVNWLLFITNVTDILFKAAAAIRIFNG